MVGVVGALLRPIFGLLVGVLLLMVGTGLLSSLVPIRLGAAGSGNAMVGLVSGAYFFGLVLGGLFVHRLISSVGHIRAFAALASLVSAAAVIHPLLTSGIVWFCVRLVTGLCMAGLFMCIESWLNDQAPDRSRGRVLSIYMVAVYVGQGVGQTLLPLPDSSGYTLFVLSSVLVSLAVIAVAAAPARGPRRPRPSRVSLRRLVEISPSGVMGALGSGLALGAFYGMAALFTQRVGMSLEETAAFMFAAIIGGVLMQWPLGMLSDRFERRAVVIGVSLATAAVAAAIVVVGQHRPELLIFLAPAFGGFAFTIYPVSIAQANDRIDRRERVAVSGALIIVYGCGAAVGPPAAATIMNVLGPSGLFVFIAAVGILLAVVAAVRLTRRAPVDTARKVPFQVMPRTSPLVGKLAPQVPAPPPPTGAPGPAVRGEGT